MSEWKEYRFSEFVEINPNVSLKGTDLYSFVEMKDLQEGSKYCFPSSLRKPASGARFKEGDTLFAKITPCLENGKICQVKGLKNGLGFGSTEFFVFRGKENVSDNDFVFYLSRWDEVRGFAESRFEGTSGRQRVPKNCFDNLFLNLPPLPEQRAIAEVLSSLDDKIDLLHRQNKTLEQLAETLFRQWFIEEAEESWEVGTLGEVITIYDNKRIPLSSGEREKMKVGKLYPYYGAAAIMDYVNDYIFDGEYILMGEDGTVQTPEGFPILQLPTGKFWVNNHAHIFQAKSPYSNFFIYIFLKQTNISGIVTGAVQPKINQEALKGIDFPIPPIEKTKEFILVTDEFWNKIKSNTQQIRTLTQLRDTLLPKLMSGEIRLNLDLQDELMKKI
jgi:type I restriction enzyme S subunit